MYILASWRSINNSNIITERQRLLRLHTSALQRSAESAQHQRIRQAMPYFDAERFARLLEREGFSAGQARAVINSLDDVVDERFIFRFFFFFSVFEREISTHLYIKSSLKKNNLIQIFSSLSVGCDSTTIVTTDLVSKADQEQVISFDGKVEFIVVIKGGRRRLERHIH